MNFNSLKPANRAQPTLRVVDLFCGAGGLSCGFDFYSGAVNYQTVLGVDNDLSAIRIFNRNFNDPQSIAKLNRGRLADMTWFQHSSEIRLFYLVHLANSRNEPGLLQKLDELGVPAFLNSIRDVDNKYAARAAILSSEDSYLHALARVPAQTFTLALVKAFLNRLGISSFNKPIPNPRNLPWAEECQVLDDTQPTTSSSISADESLLEDTIQEWDARVNELNEAAEKSGRGQNSNNASRLKKLCEFLSSEPFEEYKRLWIDWRAARATVRAEFCLRNDPTLAEIYFSAFKANIILGGPPCKGFSRIGRPVIQSLRDQGVHAWSHKEFGDERNALMCQYVLFIEALQPEVFLFENVSNFQSALKTPNGTLDAPALLAELIEELSTDGLSYHVDHRVVNARDFSVPQDRRRFIMFGAKASVFSKSFVSEFFEFEQKKADVPLRVALSGLSEAAAFEPQSGVKVDHQSPIYDRFDPLLPPEQREFVSWIQQPDPISGQRPTHTDAHIYRKPRDDDQVFASFVAPGIRWMDLKVERSGTLHELKEGLGEAINEVKSAELKKRLERLITKMDGSLLLRLLLEHTKERFKLTEQHLLLEGYLKNGGSTHGDWFERLSATKPCRTIVAHIGKDTYAYWHPTEPRSLSIREAARVQSFPDFFKFDVSGVVDTYSAIGNAVPPLLSRAFAQRTAELSSKYGIFQVDKADTAVREQGSRIVQVV